MDEQSVLNLDGYLLSLRRLSRNRCDFWAEVFDIQGDLRSDFSRYLSNRDVVLLDSSNVGYKEIDETLGEHLLTKLNIVDESLLKLFAWDIVEYIQMTYRGMEPEIDPVSSKQAVLIKAESEFHGRYVYIIIPVQNKGIAVGLATRV